MSKPEDGIDVLAGLTASRAAVDDLSLELAALGSRWSSDGKELSLFLRGSMTRTGVVTAHAGMLADEMDHHPKIVLEYAGLSLTLHTHDVGAITVIDLVYAARLEQWLRDNGWPLHDEAASE